MPAKLWFSLIILEGFFSLCLFTHLRIVLFYVFFQTNSIPTCLSVMSYFGVSLLYSLIVNSRQLKVIDSSFYHLFVYSFTCSSFNFCYHTLLKTYTPSDPGLLKNKGICSKDELPHSWVQHCARASLYNECLPLEKSVLMLKNFTVF